MKRRMVLLSGAVSVFALMAMFVIPLLQSRIERQTQIAEQEHIAKPSVEHPSSQSSVASRVSSAASSGLATRAEVNWDVPFTVQAPLGVWDALHGEACEEASILMVMRYFSNQRISSPDDAENAIQHLVAANAALGYAVDDTAAEVIKLLQSEDSSLSATLLKNPSIDDLKSVLSAGSLVIVPAAGRELHNPYFQRPGPLYHMLVLRGYTKDGYVITNDPGTKHGEQYAYRWEVLMNAMHDWNGGEVEAGQKVVVVVSATGMN